MRRLAIAFALAAALPTPLAGGAEAGADETEASAAGGEPAGTASPAAPEEAAEAEPAPEETAAGEDAASAEEPEAEEEGEPGYFAEYVESVRTRALTGLNGLATAPADPVMATVEPPKALEKAGYLRRPLGFASGFLMMLYRAFSGAVDLGFAPIPELPVVSPLPRYKLVPGFQHEDE
jgi:hypothetical protein